jgi:hypothetical protein
MQNENDWFVPSGALVREERFQALAAIPAKGPEWIAKPDRPIDADNDPPAAQSGTPPETGLTQPRRAVSFAERLLVFEGFNLDPTSLERAAS